MLRWLLLPMAVFAYLAVTVSAATPRDRDHDRLPDRWERSHHLSTTIPSAKRDPDRDRLNNLRELRLRTHPRRADTDSDRLRDGAEVLRFRTNPRRRDTDGDGFGDRCELRRGTNPRRRRSQPKRPCSKSQQTPPTEPAPPPPGGSEPSPPVEPGPIAGQGYHQVFRDDFDTLNRAVWDDHIWYDGAPSPSWTNFQYAQSGILHLVTSPHFSCGSGCNYPINTVTTQSSGRTFRYGYFEARMKWTQGNGAWPAFWLFSYRHAANPSYPNINPYCAQHNLPRAQCLVSELDIMDEGGASSDLYVGLHRNTGDEYGSGDELAPDPNWFAQDVDLAASWHSYAASWTATEVRFYLDGRMIATAPTFDSTNQPMFLLLQNWTNNGCWDCGATNGTDTDVQVDYVQVWQR